MRADPERLQGVYSHCTAAVQSVYRVSEPEPERGSGPVVPGLASEPGSAWQDGGDLTVRASQCHGCDTGGQRRHSVVTCQSHPALISPNIREHRELDTSGTRPGLGWHRCDQGAQPHSQSGEHQCLSAVDSVKVTQQNISCCEVPGCCLKASYSQ